MYKKNRQIRYKYMKNTLKISIQIIFSFLLAECYYMSET